MRAILLVFAAALSGPPVLSAEAARYRDIIGTAFQHPFLTNAEVEMYYSDVRGRVTCQGGPVLLRYPEISEVRVDGERLAGVPVGPDLLRVELPAGAHEVEVIVGRGNTVVATPPPADRPGAGSVTVSVPRERPGSLIPVVALELKGPVQTIRETYVLNGCENRLETRVAALENCACEAVRWMEKFGDWRHAECIMNWGGEESAATWEFRTLAPGVFAVDIEYTCPEAGDYSEWSLRVGGTEMIFPLIDTGERAERAGLGGALPRFRTYRVGLLELPGPSPCRLSLRPLGAAGAVVRIAGVRLISTE